MDWLSVVGGIIGILATVTGGAWFLIEQHGKSQERIKQLEGTLVSNSISDLSEVVVEHKKSINTHSDKIVHVEKSLLEIRGQLIKNNEDAKLVIENITKLKTYTDAELERIKNTLTDCEIVKLPNNAFLIRSRQKP